MLFFCCARKRDDILNAGLLERCSSCGLRYCKLREAMEVDTIVAESFYGSYRRMQGSSHVMDILITSSQLNPAGGQRRL